MKRLSFAVIILGIALLGPQTTLGKIFIVESTRDWEDSVPGNGDCLAWLPKEHACTLRAAIEEANYLAGEDTIVVPDLGTYYLTRWGADSDPNGDITQGDLDITDDLVIISLDAGGTVIQSNMWKRIFDVIGGATSLEIINLTLVGGATTDEGTIVRNGGSLKITNCWLRDSIGYGFIGAVNGLADSTTIITDSSITNNSAPLGAALRLAQHAVAQMDNGTISGNRATLNFGAAVRMEDHSDLIINYSTISENGARALSRHLGSTLRATKSIFHGSCLQLGSPLYWGGSGGNIESPGSTCGLLQPGDQMSVPESQLLLGVLADYGSGIPTHLPTSHSVAVNPIEYDDYCPQYDQRGEPRPTPPRGFLTCDVGAVERQLTDVNPPVMIFADGFESSDTSAWSAQVP